MPSRQFKYVFEIAQLSDSKLNSRCAGWGSLKEKKKKGSKFRDIFRIRRPYFSPFHPAFSY
jgi:hypothetical protein